MSNENQIGFISGADCNVTAEDTTGCAVNRVRTQIHSTTKVVGQTGQQFVTVQVWDEVGCDEDNIVRMFNKDQCVFKDGLYYWSKEDGNITVPGDAKWTDGVTACEMLKPMDDIVIPQDTNTFVTIEKTATSTIFTDTEGNTFEITDHPDVADVCVDVAVDEDPTNALSVYKSIDNPANATNWTSYDTGNISLATLTAAGMKACHNRITVRVDLSSTYSSTTAGASTFMGGVILNGVTYRQFKVKALTRSAGETGAAERLMEFDVPVGANGLDIDFSYGATGGRADAHLAQKVKVYGFRKVDLGK